MKHLILAFLVAAAATVGVANAQTVSLSYNDQHNDASKTQNHIVNLAVDQKIANNWSLGVYLNDSQNTTNKKVNDREGLNLTYSHPIYGMFSGSLRTNVSYMRTSANSAWAYYEVEPKVTAKLPLDFDVSVGYRIRRTFNEVFLDNNETMRYAIGYKFLKHEKVSVTYDHLTGDQGNTRHNPNHTYGVTFAHSF